MSAVVLTLHADRPPVMQAPRRGPVPREVPSLPKVRRDRRDRALAIERRETKRRELRDRLRELAGMRGAYLTDMNKSDAALVYEARKRLQASLDQCSACEREVLQELRELEAQRPDRSAQ